MTSAVFQRPYMFRPGLKTDCQDTLCAAEIHAAAADDGRKQCHRKCGDQAGTAIALRQSAYYSAFTNSAKGTTSTLSISG